MNRLREITPRDLLKTPWPVAAVLAVLIVVVSMAMVHGTSAPKPRPAHPVADAAATTAAVSVAPARSYGDSKRMVGAAKDPFRFADAAAQKAKNDTAGTAQRVTPSSATNAPAPATIAPVANGPVAVSPKPVVKRTYHEFLVSPLTYYVVDVRFGRLGKTPKLRRDIARLTMFPSPKHPVVLYAGAFNGGSSIGFKLDSRAIAEGGNCHVANGACDVLRLKPGQAARIAVAKDAPAPGVWVLKLVRVTKHVTRSLAVAKQVQAHVSEAAKCVLSTKGNGFTNGFFDTSTGSYELHSKACKSVKANTAATVPAGIAGRVGLLVQG